MKIVIISIVAFLVLFIVVRISQNNIVNSSDPYNSTEKVEDSSNLNLDDGNNIKTENGKQIIEITVNGGYSPEKSIAKANVPTVIRFITNNTFDCSSSISIPDLKIVENLPSTGSYDVKIDSPSIGTLKGSCGMGMYRFQIEFN